MSADFQQIGKIVIFTDLTQHANITLTSYQIFNFELILKTCFGVVIDLHFCDSESGCRLRFNPNSRFSAGHLLTACNLKTFLNDDPG